MGVEMILRAKYLVCDARKNISDGAVKISGRKISRTGKFASLHQDPGETIIDFGEAAIAPGFINAHTHLQFRKALPYNGNFADWLRQAKQAGKSRSPEESANAMRRSLDEAVCAGTTTIASTGIPADCPVRGLDFVEIICLDENNAEKKAAELKERLAQIEAAGNTACIAPHAPFTVVKSLLEHCANLAQKENRLLSIHAAESTMETTFLLGHRGELFEMLKAAGAPLDDWEPPRTTPIKYLAQAGIPGRRTLLAHCNYLTSEEVDIISHSGTSVVYCPRSSAYFGHKDHPFMRLIERGINVALGTDSLANSETLCLLDEVRFLARRFPKTPPSAFWSLATAGGAAALGLKNKTGRLKKGFSADIAVLDLTGCDGKNVFDKITAENSRIAAVFSEGKPVYDANGLISETQGHNNA